MEKIRTLYKLRKFKNTITIACAGLLLGITVFALISIFDHQLMSLFKAQISDVPLQNYQNSINNALSSCDKSFEMLEKSALIAILFSLEVLLMVFTYIRLSHKTSKFSSSAPIILGFGAILLSSYYLMIGLSISGCGQINDLLSDYQLIKVLGASLIVFANIVFVYQIFIQIVLEKVED